MAILAFGDYNSSYPNYAGSEEHKYSAVVRMTWDGLEDHVMFFNLKFPFGTNTLAMQAAIISQIRDRLELEYGFEFGLLDTIAIIGLPTMVVG